MKIHKDEQYEFGPYRLNINQFKLWRAGQEIKIRPKVFDLLVVFVRHQGRILHKKELMHSLWDDKSHVEDSNLTVNIKALRTVLNDGIYIETVSKLGYRFLPEVRQITRKSAPTPKDPIGPPGGALPLSSKLYISRPADEEFCDAITRRDSIVLVKGARQVGKTSLLARGIDAARRLDAQVLLIDFQHFGPTAFETCDKLLLTIAESIADQLDQDAQPHENWNDRLSPTTNFERFVRREVLVRDDSHFVLALDEVDRLFTYKYAGEIFLLFRSWHNARALNPDGPWHRLTIAIACATEAHLFISDLNQSPFNVGTRLTLEDFTCEQLAELNARYDSPLADDEIRRFHHLIGGHPYLSQRGLYEIYHQKTTLSALEARADRDDAPFGDHLSRLLMSLQQDQSLMHNLRDFLISGSTLSNSAFYRLRSGGVLSGEIAAEPRLRCDLYARYLQKHLT